MSKPLVGIVMGSDSDFTTMEEASKILDQFNIAHEVLVTSAHRSPERTRKYVTGAKRRCIKVMIAGAGGAAHLAGVVAAETQLPVIGVPIESKKLKGLDSLLSIVQMPKGIPVGTVAIGIDGAINSALLASSIISISNLKIKKNLISLRKNQSKKVKKKPR